jgi:hypothetical protein
MKEHDLAYDAAVAITKMLIDKNLMKTKSKLYTIQLIIRHGVQFALETQRAELFHKQQGMTKCRDN